MNWDVCIKVSLHFTFFEAFWARVLKCKTLRASPLGLNGAINRMQPNPSVPFWYLCLSTVYVCVYVCVCVCVCVRDGVCGWCDGDSTMTVWRDQQKKDIFKNILATALVPFHKNRNNPFYHFSNACHQILIQQKLEKYWH